MFLHSPRFELPMGASEQPPLPQQNQNQAKVRIHTNTQMMHPDAGVDPFQRMNQHGSRCSCLTIRSCCWGAQWKQSLSACLLPQPVPTIGRSSLSLIQLTNSTPAQRQQNNMTTVSQQNNLNANRGPRPLDQVTCYKVSQPYICVIKAMPVSLFGRNYNH